MEPLIKEKAEARPEDQPQRTPSPVQKDEGPGFPNWLRWFFNFLGLLILAAIAYLIIFRPPGDNALSNKRDDIEASVIGEMERMDEVREALKRLRGIRSESTLAR